MSSKGGAEDFDWSSTWVAEMFMTQAEKDRKRGLTPEMKRRREIKAGVITAAVGFSLMIILFVLMNGIIAGGRVSDAAAEILSRLWIVGIIPLLVGGALIFNGIFLNPKGRRLSDADEDARTNSSGLPFTRGYERSCSEHPIQRHRSDNEASRPKASESRRLRSRLNSSTKPSSEAQNRNKQLRGSRSYVSPLPHWRRCEDGKLDHPEVTVILHHQDAEP
jgi:hypothetical protein